jgi:hypothetical protein
MRQSIHNYFRGDVSRVMLLTRLLPLSAVVLFGALITGAALYPGSYDWRLRVVSHLISPMFNPQGYWIASLGLALSAVLVIPFAGYVARRLSQVNRGLASVAGVAFMVGFLLFLSVAVPQSTNPTHAARVFHEVLARGSVLAIAIGMFSCSVCAIKDRLRLLGGQQSLRGALTVIWSASTLLPIAILTIGAGVKFGREAEQDWAAQVHNHLQDSVLWRLAFWEWLGIVMLFVFLFLSVLLLPERIRSSPATIRS